VSTQQANAQKASEMTAEDLAKRCTEARQRYQTYMESHRLYTEDPNGQRQYLSSEEIDAARATAKQAMDQFCGGK
jgi:hypothetical protein